MQEEGWGYLTPVDNQSDQGLGMTSMLFLEKVFRILRTGWLAHNHYGTPCTSFTFAITPPVRSPEFPEGRHGLSERWQEKVAAGSLVAEVASRCIVISAHAGTDVTEENPDPCYHWSHPAVAAGVLLVLTFRAIVFYCAFDTPFRKRTRVVGNNGWVVELAAECCGLPREMHQNPAGQDAHA